MIVRCLLLCVYIVSMQIVCTSVFCSYRAKQIIVFMSWISVVIIIRFMMINRERLNIICLWRSNLQLVPLPPSLTTVHILLLLIVVHTYYVCEAVLHVFHFRRHVQTSEIWRRADRPAVRKCDVPSGSAASSLRSDRELVLVQVT